MSKTVSAVCLLALLGCGNHDGRSFADEQVVALVNVACFDPVPDPLKAGWTKEGNGTATVGTPLALSDPSSAPSDFINYFCADSTIFAGDIVLTPHFTIARHDIHFCQKLVIGGISMNRQKYFVFFLVAFVLSAVAITYPTKKASAHGDDRQFIAESSLLAGLAPGAVFPFIDTTPHKIAQAHIAITDSSSDCHPGSAPPDNIKILVGQAGVALVSVMDKTTNTGISTTPGQCVFHVTINAGQAGVPNTVTDIVVLNGGSAALTGINTVTASATVRVDNSALESHLHGQGASDRMGD